MVSERGIDVDPDKVCVVHERGEPTNLEELRSFLGMTGYYRGHIKDYAHMASPLHALTKKNVPWEWGPDEGKGYHRLLTTLVGNTMFAHPRVEEEGWILDTDASGYALGAVLSQVQEECLTRHHLINFPWISGLIHTHASGLREL
jgi:hypothetical protein